jgi:hypothetical protein
MHSGHVAKPDFVSYRNAVLLPLEQLGLFYMLERIDVGTGSVQDFACVGFLGGELIDASDPPMLTEIGRDKLQALRLLLTAAND